MGISREEIHKMNELLNEIRTAIAASDKIVTEQFKRHIALVSNSRERVKSAQEEIDKLQERESHEKND